MTTDTPYRVLFCDLLTDRPIDVLPLRDVSFDDYIGRSGSLTGTIPVPDARIAARARKIVEGRTSVYLERGNDLWWGGIVWTTTPASDDKGVLTLAVQAATFDSYAARRRIRTSVVDRGGRDQLQIARILWRLMQQRPSGDIGVVFESYEDSGVEQSVAWWEGDEVTYEEAMHQIAEQGKGFEHHIVVRRDPVTGQRTRLLRLGSPELDGGPADLVLDRPGTILSYAFPRDATRGGTHSRARGGNHSSDPNGEGRPVSSREWVAEELIEAGWPQIDLSAENSSATTRGPLDFLAWKTLQDARGAVVIPEVTVRLDGSLPVAPELLSRTVRLRITDEWHPEGLDRRYRVIGIKVSPPQRGRPETAELYLEAP
ncbi:hypothetical protein [Streptomyces sp. NPDC058953]|uniref:hypothetical protein n=1 Tax=unclassified Streptomyces TaxID=2593676 RepID=UPI0036BBBEBC